MTIKKKKTNEKPELKENERFCFKCKRVVHKSEYETYYEICKDCANKSTGH